MPIPIVYHLLSSQWHLSTRTYICIGLTVLLLLLRSWTSAPLPRVPHPRRLRGQIVMLIDPPGFSPASLPLIESLLKRSCQVIVLVSPKHIDSPRVLQLFALLKENGPVKHAQLYMEALDLQDEASIEAFGKEWVKRGAAKKGLMGEEIGVVQVAGIVFLPDTSIEIKQKLALVKKLSPTLTAPSKLPADPLLPTATQTRVVNVVESPFYAAASASNALQHAKPLSGFQSKAVHSLNEALQWHKAAQEMKDPVERISLVSLSPGLTRSALTSTLDGIQTALLRVILLACCMPLIWALGKSHSEAMTSVEWLLVKADVKPATLYRDGKEVQLKEFADTPVKA